MGGVAEEGTMASVQVAEFGYFVGSRVATEGESLEVRSCYDGTLVARTFRPAAPVIEEAVSRTVRSTRSRPQLATFERAEILQRTAAEVELRKPEFVRMLALEAGKPVKAGRVEVDRCVFNFRNAAEESKRVASELLPLDLLPAGRNRFALVRRFPLGTLLAITPFNFPLNLVAHKLAPAFASGNSVVQKPASKTPISSLMLARAVYDAGLPEDCLSVLPCSAGDAEKLAADERFQMLTFTGSSDVGWKLKTAAGRKKVALELGGNAGVIVHSDTDLEDAAARCAAGGFSYSGQSCISVQRIFVHRPVWDTFLALLVRKVEALKVGDPMEETTDVGPMISVHDALRVEEWVGEAVAAGASVLTGGKRAGAVYFPTVIVGAGSEARVNCCEVFGPVVTVRPYDDWDEAFALVNDSRFGLQAGVFTRDLNTVFKAFELLEVGGVIANDVPTFRADHMPYGGAKDSGTGREGVRYAIEEMTERKTLVVNLG